MRRRSRTSVAATVLWLVAAVLAVSWLENQVPLSGVATGLIDVVVFLVGVVLWNLDRIRAAWGPGLADDDR